jgi:hypothetical protein
MEVKEVIILLIILLAVVVVQVALVGMEVVEP